ncbi:MAG: hypothetical protein IPI46_10265 [Bacteroidetes bacterium]|nr:hypothetical protein [Bacteroidota bacterium]
MLLNNFFFIDAIEHETGFIKAVIHINEQHEILKGHFPTQPIVPGVCMLEMLREVLEHALACRLQMQTSQVIKFLSMFLPTQNKEAEFVIQYVQNEQGNYVIDASLLHNTIVYMKCKAAFAIKL